MRPLQLQHAAIPLAMIAQIVRQQTIHLRSLEQENVLGGPTGPNTSAGGHLQDFFADVSPPSDPPELEALHEVEQSALVFERQQYAGLVVSIIGVKCLEALEASLVEQPAVATQGIG